MSREGLGFYLVRTGGNACCEKQCFQLGHHVWAEDVLDGVRIPIHVAWRDIRVGDEIKFPQAVLADDECRFAKALLGEFYFSIGGVGFDDEPVPDRASDFTREPSCRPRAHG